MGQGPFAKRSTASSVAGERRQSSHVAHVVPVVITGRDASGQAFREVTETFSVSLHGAAIFSRKQVPIGTQLTIECSATGVVAKCICVRVREAAPGEERGMLAVQLLMPANVWGVKNPPTDWLSSSERTAPAARTLSAPVAPTTFSELQTVPAPAAVLASDLEQRSAELVESTLKLLRSQVAGILRESVKTFEERLKFLESGTEAQIIQRAERAINEADTRVKSNAEQLVEDAELELARLRRELMDQLSARTERVIQSAEATLREKLDDLLEEVNKQRAAGSAEKPKENPEQPAQGQTQA